jgi:hypothetical protein
MKGKEKMTKTMTRISISIFLLLVIIGGISLAVLFYYAVNWAPLLLSSVSWNA